MKFPPFRSLVPEICPQVRQFYSTAKVPPLKRLINPYKTLSFLIEVYLFRGGGILFYRLEQERWKF